MSANETTRRRILEATLRCIERWGLETAQRVFAEAHAALDTVREVIALGSIDCDRQPDGWLKVAHRPGRVAALEAEARLLEREFGYEARFIDRAALHAGYLGGAEAHGALRWPDGFALHPMKLAFGLLPNSDFLKGAVELTPRGEIIVDAKGQTNIPGVFAAGDVTTVPYKQIVIAVGEGAKASLSAFDHLIRTSAPA